MRPPYGNADLVVLNTVERAVGVFDALGRKARGASIDLVLLHSRFRPADRDAALNRALAPDFDGIVVSTQVIEAGIDVSALVLFTDLAPGPSLVQRAGRCNRTGEYPDAVVVWFDHAAEDAGLRATSFVRFRSSRLRAWTDSGRHAWRWDPLDGTWVAARRDQIVPGGVLMLQADEGGYTSERGWDARSRTPVVVVSTTASAREPEEDRRGPPLGSSSSTFAAAMVSAAETPRPH